MRNLYVIRHGEAVPLGGDVRSDRDRPLTARGAEDLRLVGELCARTDQEIALVLCSPVLRALQSGAEFARAMPARPEVRESVNLAPGFRPKGLLQELRGLEGEASVAIVGHQPDLSILLAFLIDGEAPSAILLPPGGIACVGFPAGMASDPSLHWLLTPEILRHWSPTR
jgi:phosphohistidine phosphatase